MTLENRVALVTGASRGIGRAIATTLAAKGADVAVNYRSKEDQAQQVVAQIRSMGRKALSFRANVGKYGEAEEMIEAVRRSLGDVNILVNNAGIAIFKSLRNMSEEEWDASMETNLKGVFNCTKLVLPDMIRRGDGNIISMSSITGFTGYRTQTAYASSKAGVIGFSLSLAKEVGRFGIRVNVVIPGWIPTGMTELLSEEERHSLLARIPLGRPGTPEEIAEVVAFLASPAASYVTGAIIPVTAGAIP